MTQREAQRLALLICADLLDRAADEFTRHPESNEEFSRDDFVKVQHQSRRIAKRLETRAMHRVTDGEAP